MDDSTMSLLMAIIGLLGVVAVCVCVGYVTRPPRHRHTWKATNTTVYRHMTYNFAFGKEMSNGDTTTVLYVCKTCGQGKTEELDGKWYIEDFA